MKKFTLKWKWITVAMLTATVLIAISWEFMTAKGLEVFLNHSVSSLTGRNLAVGNLYHEKEHWVVDNPHLSGDEFAENAHFKASRAIVSYTIDLWRGEIDLYITLEQPEFKINQPDSNFSLWLEKLETPAGLFKINKHIAIYAGRLNLDEREYEINGEMSISSSFEGNFHVDFREGPLENNHLFINFARGPSPEWYVDFQCQEVDCFHLHHAVSYLFPALQELKIHDGVLNGNGGVIFGHLRKPLIYGEANLVRFNFEHEPTEVKGSLKEVRFHLQKNPEASFISHGSIIFCGNETLSYGADGEIRNLMGGIYVDDQARAKIVLNGIYDNFGTTYNLLVEGEGTFPAQDYSMLNLVWQLENLQTKSSGSLKLKEHAEKKYDAQFDLKHLRFQDVLALQPLIKNIFPSLDEVVLKEGVLDISARAYINKKKLEMLIFDNINVNHLKAYYLPWQTSLAIENISGLASFDFVGDTIEDDSAIQLNVFNLKLSDSFDLHKLVVTADHNHHDNREEIIGVAKIIDSTGVEKPVTFGFELSKGNSTSELFTAYFQLFALQPLPFSLPPQLPTTRTGGYHIKNGWFQAKALPLEKYLAPFFIDEQLIKLTGIGDFHGHFDDGILRVTYDAHHVNLENNALAIEAGEIRQDPLALTRPVHYFDLSTGTHFGFLPLMNATYFEKNSGLLFTDVNAEVVFEGKNIHVPTVESFCNGIYMAGALAVDFNELHDGYFDVDIHPQSVHGKLTQVQSFFSHFQKSFFFLKVPLEGEVTMHQDAGSMHFAFSPNDYVMQIYLKGSLSDGMIITNNSNVALQEISLNFEYDHQANILDFSEIQGTLLVGEPERVEEYTIIGEKIHFSDYAHNRASFDIWIGDRKRDVIRLAGETYTSNICFDESCIQFALDKQLSHFGNVHPQDFHLILKDWWQIQEFRLIADFKLATLFQDLQRFSRTGFLFFSRHSLKQLNDMKKAAGTFKIDVKYDHKQSRLDYQVIGQEVAIDSYTFDNVVLEGKKTDDTWIIDQLVMDNVSIAADILHKPGSWFINFLGVKLGNSVLMGLQGEYFEDSRNVDGKINLLEVDIEEAHEWNKAHEFLEKYPLKGHLRASGQFHYECADSKLDVLLNTTLKEWEFKGLSFEDINNASLHYASDKGLIIRKINTALKSEDNKKTDLRLEKFEYDFSQDIFSLENLDFVISSDIPKVIDHVAQQFPEAFSPVVTNMIAFSKQNGTLEGSLSFDYADPHYAIKLALKDGEYCFLNKKILLSDFVLDYDPCEVKIVAKCHGHALPFWMQYKSSCAHFNQGELIITEESPVNMPANPLTIEWQNNSVEGFSINKAAGHFHGMTLALTRDTSKEPVAHAHFLEGVIEFNAKDAAFLISPVLSEKLAAWQMGSGYNIKGQWELHPANEANELLKTYFVGRLEGQNFEFKGYQFDRLYAEMISSPNHIFLNNVHVTDLCGNFQMAQLRFNKHRNDLWKMSLAKAEVRDFKPSFMRKAGIEQANNPKSLIIRELKLENLQGVLGNSDSFIGKGFLVFVNPPQKNTNHPIFAIPGEVLTHLGLDLAVLNPVVGTIIYEVKDSKIFLTKLKDAYSQGKMSKFYLPDSHKSFIDFEGNLNMQIKMKQYSLFFKLAELFTVTVQGTWQKPTYTLQKKG